MELSEHVEEALFRNALDVDGGGAAILSEQVPHPTCIANLHLKEKQGWKLMVRFSDKKKSVFRGSLSLDHKNSHVALCKL